MRLIITWIYNMPDNGIIRKLYNCGILKVPHEFVKDVHYEVINGSVSYGVSDDTSDVDCMGVCIPPPDFIFPYSIGGYLKGFGGEAPPDFNTLQQHHIPQDEKTYDVVIYSLVKFFQLAANSNPNMCAYLFVHERHITHIDNIGRTIRQNRKLFLTRQCFDRFTSYAYSQLKKMRTMNPKGKRHELFQKHGYDVKYAAHLVRLCLEAQQILTEGDLDLERNAEIQKSIRRGEWTMEQVETWFREKESSLNKLYTESSLPFSPPWDELKQVLMCCLEEKYGSLSAYINVNSDARIMRKFEQIKQIVNS